MILVAGNIATGKTTLARKISEELNIDLIEEDVEGNDFIEYFYIDMKRWSLHSQLHFILSRADRLRAAYQNGRRFVIDRSPSEDFHIFSRNLLSSGNMTSNEYDLIRKTYSHIRHLEDGIKICFYLYDDVDRIYARVLSRNNQYEHGIEKSYLSRINGLYSEWRDVRYFETIIDINTTDIDFRDEIKFKAEILSKIPA